MKKKGIENSSPSVSSQYTENSSSVFSMYGSDLLPHFLSYSNTYMYVCMCIHIQHGLLAQDCPIAGRESCALIQTERVTHPTVQQVLPTSQPE